MKPVEVIEKMAVSLNLTDKKHMYEQVCIASKTVQKSDAKTRAYFAKSSNGRDPRYIVSKWRLKVSKDEEKRAFEILSRFKIDIYSFGEDMPTRRL
jgi:hypothetical protein